MGMGLIDRGKSNGGWGLTPLHTPRIAGGANDTRTVDNNVQSTSRSADGTRCFVGYMHARRNTATHPCSPNTRSFFS